MWYRAFFFSLLLWSPLLADVALTPSNFGVYTVDENGVNRYVEVSNVRYFWTGTDYRLLFSYALSGGTLSPVDLSWGTNGTQLSTRTNSGGNINQLLGPGQRTAYITLRLGSQTRTEMWSFDGVGGVEESAQTITGTPLTGTVDLGFPFHFTVTGNETELVFSRTMEIGSGAGSFFFHPEEVGTHIFHVYAAAGDGYDQSNTLTFTVNVKGYRVNVSLPANTSKYITSYEVHQSGELITTLVQVPGAAARSQTVDVPTNQPVTITPYISGIREDGSIFVEDSEGTLILQPVTVEPVTIEDPADVPEPTPSVNIDGAPKDPTDDGSKSVWDQTDEEGTEAKDKTVKEGVDKIVDSLDEINKTLKARLPGGGSGSGTDMSGVEGRLDELIEIERARDEANKVETPSTLQDAQAAAQNAPEYEGAEINEGTPTASGISSFTPTLGTWQIAPGHTITLSLLPDAIWSGASSILTACKPLILWAAVIGFIMSCGSVLDGYVQGLPQVNAASAAVGVENMVPGVAQGKTWTAAALLVGAMVVAAALFVGYVQTAASANGVGLSSLFSAMNLSSVGAGLGVLEQYVPIAGLLSLAVLRAGFSYVCAPAYMLATSAMKFFQA